MNVMCEVTCGGKSSLDIVTLAVESLQIINPNAVFARIR